MKEIIRNRAKCLMCGDIIESTYRNDFRSCSCGNLHVDGGKDYIRRGFRNGKESFQNMNEFKGYEWDEGFVSNDGHAWCMGVDLLHCPRMDMDETVTLQIRVPFVKAPVPVDCKVYSVAASLFTAKPPIKEFYIAICEYRHSTVLFVDEDTLQPVIDHVNESKGTTA